MLNVEVRYQVDILYSDSVFVLYFQFTKDLISFLSLIEFFNFDSISIIRFSDSSEVF